MQNVEKIGIPKEVWVMCPGCHELFFYHRLFHEPKYNHVNLHCPFCHKEFPKEEAAKTWGV